MIGLDVVYELNYVKAKISAILIVGGHIKKMGGQALGTRHTLTSN
jgi:hypothetical protein